MRMLLEDEGGTTSSGGRWGTDQRLAAADDYLIDLQERGGGQNSSGTSCACNVERSLPSVGVGAFSCGGVRLIFARLLRHCRLFPVVLHGQRNAKTDLNRCAVS